MSIRLVLSVLGSAGTQPWLLVCSCLGSNPARKPDISGVSDVYGIPRLHASAEGYSRVTVLMVGLLSSCCKPVRLRKPYELNAIMFSAVERGLLRPTEEDISYLGIGEKSSEKGQTCARILTDIERVLDLAPQREVEATK